MSDFRTNQVTPVALSIMQCCISGPDCNHEPTPPNRHRWGVERSALISKKHCLCFLTAFHGEVRNLPNPRSQNRFNITSPFIDLLLLPSFEPHLDDCMLTGLVQFTSALLSLSRSLSAPPRLPARMVCSSSSGSVCASVPPTLLSSTLVSVCAPTWRFHAAICSLAARCSSNSAGVGSGISE
jgi:hypothetical protein